MALVVADGDGFGREPAHHGGRGEKEGDGDDSFLSAMVGTGRFLTRRGSQGSEQVETQRAATVSSASADPSPPEEEEEEEGSSSGSRWVIVPGSEVLGADAPKARKTFLQQDNELAEMRQRVHSQSDFMGELRMQTKEMSANVEDRREQLCVKIRTLKVADKTVGGARSKLQEPGKLLSGDCGHGHLKILERMLRMRQRYMIGQVAQIYPVRHLKEQSPIVKPQLNSIVVRTAPRRARGQWHANNKKAAAGSGHLRGHCLQRRHGRERTVRFASFPASTR